MACTNHTLSALESLIRNGVLKNLISSVYRGNQVIQLKVFNRNMQVAEDMANLARILSLYLLDSP